MAEMIMQILIRTLSSALVGIIIGRERAKHGRAAGMRTHVLVCLGACMTSMTSIYVSEALKISGDVFRVPAQVVSGIGFLGAGMIILKSNNIISGLTTAAGVWTTATIGIAIGYGFYWGVAIVTAIYIIAIVLLAKFEQNTKGSDIIYIEIDNLDEVNSVINTLKNKIPQDFNYQVIAPKSGQQGNLGLNIVISNKCDFNIDDLAQLEHIAYSIEE